MKIKRQKNCRKVVRFFKLNFGFKAPFQILVDGTFCQAALNNKINIKEQLPKYLDHDVIIFVTSCVLHELNSLGKDAYGAFHIAKQYKLKKCDHLDKPIGPNKCLLSLVKKGNPSHYWIASQDPELTEKINTYLGVPLLYICYNAIILSKQNEVSKQIVNKNIKELLHKEVSSSNPISEEQKCLNKEFKYKRKMAKGPNPLSCLKKKKK